MFPLICYYCPFWAHPESTWRGYRYQPAAGRDSAHLRSGRATTEGDRGVQHEIGETEILVGRALNLRFVVKSNNQLLHFLSQQPAL